MECSSSNAECAQHLSAVALTGAARSLAPQITVKPSSAHCMQMPGHKTHHAFCLLCSYSDVNKHACSGCHSECSPKVAFLYLDELTGHLHGIFEWELFMPADKEVVRMHDRLIWALCLHWASQTSARHVDSKQGARVVGFLWPTCPVAVFPLHAFYLRI